MLKAKTVGIEDSNIAHLGGKEEHDARKSAAEGEKAFAAAGKVAGIEIWRIEKLEVHNWPKEQYGTFFSGDAYIILKTNVSKEGKYSWDVHFWLGATASIDERGVAAYKTVELDDILGGFPVQYREVEGQESGKFVSYFKNIIVMSGGIDTGFNHVKPESYNARLLWCKGKGKDIRVSQCATTATSEMNHGDVFILDTGLVLYQFNGKSAGPFEKRKAAEICAQLDADRKGLAKIEVVEDNGSDKSELWSKMKGTIADIKEAKDGGDDTKVGAFAKKLYRLSDKDGKMTFKEVATGVLLKSALDPADIFFVDVGIRLFVWVGKGASKGEKKEAMVYAEKYLGEKGRPSNLPVSRVIDGAELDSEFEAAFK